MDLFSNPQDQKRGVNKGLIIGALVGIVAIALAVWVLSLRPSMQDQMAQILEGSFHEGSPEFEQITKDIVIATDPNTVQSPNAFGKISMFIGGNIRNKGLRVIDGLEVKCSVVTQFNDVIKEKRVLVVPTQKSLLEPGQTIPITLSLDGFDRKDDRANIRWKVTAIRTQN